MAKRAKISEATETQLFTKSGRRCAICFALHGDTAVKAGQIAHLLIPAWSTNRKQ
jgi:hypothetical protein